MSSSMLKNDDSTQARSTAEQVEAKSVRPPKRPRSPWRQSLAEAERGLTQSFRGDSKFFVHFFIGMIILSTAMVLGLSQVQWALVILSLTFVMCSELFYQVLKMLWKGVGHHFDDTAQHTIRTATAAVLVAMCGSSLVIAIIFISEFVAMFTG